MCGIAGIYGFLDKNLLKKISNTIRHRGPDGEGFFFDKEIALLNRRLAIIDIKGGKQPMYNEDRSVVVVYNGEIYNFLDLKKELEYKGHIFKTRSDTEVIVHAYEEWEEKAFDKFNGMFAFALYDKKKEKLIIVRDHFGIKPLYYAYNNKKFIFCSEIKPILLSKIVQKKPNDRVIYRYLVFRVHDDNKETFFQNIYRVMPGEMLIVEKKDNSDLKINREKYTKLIDKIKQNVKKEQLISQETILKTKEILRSIVLKRLISDVKVGSCLSGGIDSSTIVVLINQLLKEKITDIKNIENIQQTFSVVFPKQTNNEEKYIDILVNKFKITSFKTNPNPNNFLDDLEDFIKTQEEPTISTGPYAQYSVFKLAHKYVKVILDGQGLDEILAGYLPYYFVYFNQLKKQKKYFKLLRELWFSKKIIFYLLKQNLKKIVFFKNKETEIKLFNEMFLKRFKNEKFKSVSDNLKLRLLEDIFFNSLPALLRYEDKNSMRFSIEGRVPFVDYDFISFIFSLSDEAIIKNGINKFIIREAMKDFLPKEILKRSDKIGFTTPEYNWFFQIKDKILEIFSSENFSRRKYFNQKEVILAFIDFLNKKNYDTMIFWRIINLELWLRIFFDSDNVKNNKTTDIKKIIKKNKIIIQGKKYLRYLIKTKIIKKNDDLCKYIPDYLSNFINNDLLFKNKKFFLVLSEKIVAISQGRSFFIWMIRPSFTARVLSFFVTKTPFGIGLGSPWTMELAIKEVGLFRILLASFLAMLARLIGIRGLFYKIAGKHISTIDGPTDYSVYPSNISAKLPPKDPEKFSQLLHLSFLKKIKNKNNFLGVVIIDANDLGQRVLANTTNLENKLVENIFKDNPMGQAKEQTPLTLVVLN